MGNKPSKPTASNAPSKKKNTKKKNTKNILWRPLDIIMNDDILLHALVEESKSQFNAENISFLIAVKELKAANSCDIDSKITKMYDQYVEKWSKQEVNVGDGCRKNIRAGCQQLDSLTDSEKIHMFDQAVDIVSKLIYTVVLPRAYKSEAFLRKAKKSKQYKALLKAANLR